MEAFDLFLLTPVTWGLNLICAMYLYRFSALLIEYRKYTKILFMVFGMALFSLPIYLTDTTNVLGMLTVFFLFMLFFAKGKLAERLSAVLILFPLILGLNYLLYNSPMYVYIIRIRLESYVDSSSITIREYLLTLGGQIVLGVLRIGFCALLYYGFKNRLKGIKGYLSSKIWLIVGAVSTVSFISIMTVIMYPPLGVERTSGYAIILESFGTFIIVISGMLSIIGILFLLQPLIDNVKNKEKLYIEGLKEEYYHSLEEQQENVRKLRHDMNNHFQALKGCLDQGETEAARNYLEQFGDSLPKGGGKNFCRDSALNAVLNNRYEKLLRLGTDIHFNLEVDHVMEIPSLELCTIFSNALDNAIEAVAKVPEQEARTVTLQARNEKGYFSLQLINSKVNQIETDNGRVKTNKKEAGHGYGIENIREIAERYGGEVQISYTEDEFILFLYMPLQ